MIRLCTICARGGSRGVINKNIRLLLGKPLIAYSIEQAKKAGIFDEIVVSSDSDEILEIAKGLGTSFIIKRPKELASDEAGKLPSIIHCVEEMENLKQRQYDVVVDLDITSPLREIDDIIQVVNLLEEKQVSNVITGTFARRSPYFNIVEENEKGFVYLSKIQANSIVRRQDSPKCYDLNASIYVWNRDALTKYKTIFYPDTLLFVMPQERSLDIDTELDLEIVEFLMKRRLTNG